MTRSAHRLHAAQVAFACAWALAACGPGLRASAPVDSPGAQGPGLRARLAVNATRFAPAQVQLSGEGALRGEDIADVDACEGCHGDVADQFQTSAHAFSSFNNPLYRFGVDGFRERVGRDESQMCGGCHDMALLVDDVMPGEVRPDDERAHAGITCRVCHGIESARPDGNGSYILSRTPPPAPVRGDADSVAAHVAAVQPLGDDALCGTCHRSFLSTATGNDHFLSGMDDFGAWRSSAYNGHGAGRIDPGARRARCRDCHMAREVASLGDASIGVDGKVASHRFLGGHTWLAAMRGDTEQLERLRDFLRDTVSVDLAAARAGEGDWHRPAEGTPALPGQELQVDVVVRNVGVGHAFPGGVRDAVDSWLAVELHDARGALLASTQDDDGAHRFRTLVGDEHGKPQLMRNTERFYEAVVDHTVAARDARVIRYAVMVPEDLPVDRFPIRVSAKLLHRSRNLAFQAGVCAVSRGARGQAFAETQRKLLGLALDPCTPQPLSVVGETQAWVGKGSEARSRRRGQGPPLALRLYEHALGLLGELSSEASHARRSLLEALELLQRPPSNPERELHLAMVYSALAAVQAGAPCGPSAEPGWPSCAGRLRETLRWLDRAEGMAPGHPALARIRAQAHRGRAQWTQAAQALSQAAAAVPENTGIQRALAMTLSGLGQHPDALRVAQEGLRLTPRDDDLLRVQARALAELGADPGEVSAAEAAYDSHRRAHRPTAMRALCIAHDPRCRQERLSVHTHRLTPVTADERTVRGTGEAPTQRERPLARAH